MKMGSYIVRASHVGTSARTSIAYPGPATDEEMEIAKRAAQHTKKNKSSLKKLSRKKKKSKKSAEKKNNDSPNATKVSDNSKSRISHVVKPKIRAAPKIIETALSKQARRLGISEEELMRKIKAVKEWKSENK